jgi:homoserine/homoserine lactone efflux protein
MDARVFFLYVAWWTLVALTPGPAVMYSMATATRHGFRTGLAGICGIQAGNFVLFGAVAVGLGTVLTASDGLFAALRTIGAGYLFWLGGRTIVRTFRPSDESKAESAGSLDPKSAVQGLLVQVTNPKALLFVSAFLPQFIDRTRSPYLQLAILVVTTIVVDMIVLSGYALLARMGTQRLRRSRFKLWCERVYGAGLICFGGRLLAARK